MFLITVISSVLIFTLALFFIANGSTSERDKSFSTWLKSITSDLREQSLPVIISMLIGKSKIAHSNRPYLAMTRNSKKTIKLVIAALLLYLGAVSWNFGWYHIAQEDSSKLFNALLISVSVFVGVLLVLDIIIRIALISVSGIYSGLTEDGYSIITSKLLSIFLALLPLIVVVSVPTIYKDIIFLGFEREIVLWVYFAIAMIVWLFTFGLLFQTLLNPKKYFSESLSLKNTLRMSDHMIKGAFIMVLIIIFGIYAAVITMHRLDATIFLFEEETYRIAVLQYVFGLMTTIGGSGIVATKPMGMVITTFSSITAIITFGLFIKAVFDRNFIKKESGNDKGVTKFVYVDDMTLAQLRKFCADEGIKVPATATRDDIIKILERLFT